MNHLANITRKELKELLTPGTIVSILLVVILFSALGTAMSGESESSAAPKHMGVIYGGDWNETIVSYEHIDPVTHVPVTVDLSMDKLLKSAYLSTYKVSNPSDYIVTLTDDDEKAISEAIHEKDLAAVIKIPADFKTRFDSHQTTNVESYYGYSQGGIFSTVTSAMGKDIKNNINSILSFALMTHENTKTFAAFANSPITTTSHTDINGKMHDDVTPYAIYSALMGQNMIIPIIVMIVIVMVGSVVISSMGSEKENKTLETLLTMPIKRTTIVSGKLLAAAIMGLVYGVCYLAGMMVYSNGITSGISGGSVNLTSLGLAMSTLDWIILMIVLFLAIFSALGICMILGAFTKNYKMAQTMTLPISGLAIIPMFIFMFTSWESLPGIGQVLVFLIPFSHPMMAMNNLMFDNFLLVIGGVIYLLVFDIITILITVKIYNSDILITGIEQTRPIRALKKVFKIKEREHEERGDN
ncbi:MAG: ABC transporter permease [archaeon]|nr:ABC transporter permease [archaeon]